MDDVIARKQVNELLHDYINHHPNMANKGTATMIADGRMTYHTPNGKLSIKLSILGFDTIETTIKRVEEIIYLLIIIEYEIERFEVNQQSLENAINQLSLAGADMKTIGGWEHVQRAIDLAKQREKNKEPDITDN